MKKVYRVEFMKYTDYGKTRVASNTQALDYIDTYKGDLLIFEDEIERYQGYGGGIKSLNFVGYIQEYHEMMHGKTPEEER